MAEELLKHPLQISDSQRRLHPLGLLPLGVLLLILLPCPQMVLSAEPVPASGDRIDSLESQMELSWNDSIPDQASSLQDPQVLQAVFLADEAEIDQFPGDISSSTMDLGDAAQESLPLRARFDEGFELESSDRKFQLRIRVLNQVDGKLFVPTDQQPARSGLYIPRFRIYFEGQLTELFEYELSLQRSVEGAFDVLDANINFVASESLQVRVGRALVPYSYSWYDHLEQFYITPERGLFPINFGLARQAGVSGQSHVEFSSLV